MTQALATTAATQPLSESEALQPVTLTKRDVERLINLGLERGRAEATPSRIGGMTIGEAQAWAVVVRTAGLIPQEKSKQGQPVTPIEVLEARAVAKIMAGNSWGINPFEAQSLFHFIPQSGTIVPHYKAFLMRIKLSGKYDYELVELTDEKCTLRGFKHGQPLVPDVTFTLDEAIKAGLYNPKLAAGEEKWPDGNVKQKGAWEAYTKDKLLARATTRLFGRHFPELYSSMPVTKTVEDLEDEGILAAQPAQIAAPVVDPADEPFSSVPVPVPATAPEPEAEPETEPEAIDAEPVSEPPPTARDRVSDLRLQLLNFGIDAEDLETQFLPDGVSSFDALTEDQAAEIVPDMEAVREAKSNAAVVRMREDEPTAPRLMTRAELREYLRCSESTLARRIAEGMPSRGSRLFDKEEVDQWMRRCVK